MLTRLLAECADHTPEKDLREVLAVMGILAAENDLVTLNAFVEGLSNAVLLDAVICNMDHLPPRELVCGDAPAVTGGLGDLAGLMQVRLHACRTLLSSICALEVLVGSSNSPFSHVGAIKQAFLDHVHVECWLLLRICNPCNMTVC